VSAPCSSRWGDIRKLCDVHRAAVLQHQQRTGIRDLQPADQVGDAVSARVGSGHRLADQTLTEDRSLPRGRVRL